MQTQETLDKSAVSPLEQAALKVIMDSTKESIVKPSGVKPSGD